MLTLKMCSTIRSIDHIQLETLVCLNNIKNGASLFKCPSEVRQWANMHNETRSRSIKSFISFFTSVCLLLKRAKESAVKEIKYMLWLQGQCYWWRPFLTSYWARKQSLNPPKDPKRATATMARPPSAWQKAPPQTAQPRSSTWRREGEGEDRPSQPETAVSAREREERASKPCWSRSRRQHLKAQTETGGDWRRGDCSAWEAGRSLWRGRWKTWTVTVSQRQTPPQTLRLWSLTERPSALRLSILLISHKGKQAKCVYTECN